jgi:MFS family permease
MLGIRDRDIWLVYVSIFLLGIAYGVSISLVALHLDAIGMAKEEIGALAAAFAGGIVAMSLPAGAIVRRLSAKRTLVISIVGYAVTVSAFPWVRSMAALSAIRFFDGAFSVAAWVACETILLARSGERNKAKVTSLYAMAIAIGYVLGPLAAEAIVAAAPLALAFVVSGAIALVAAALAGSLLSARAERSATGKTESSVDPATTSATTTAGILARTRTSCLATFSYGYFQASVVLFLPLYLIQDKSIAREQTILVPAFFAAGMLLFSTVAARFGDRYGHLRVMRVLGAVGMSMVLGFVVLETFPLMCAAVFVAGATLASISPVSLAFQGVVTNKADLARANAIYNAFYAAGMLVGPPASSAIFARLGGGAMLLHLAGLWLVFVLFTVACRRDDPRFADDAFTPAAPRAIPTAAVSATAGVPPS